MLAGSSETIRAQNAEVANAVGSALCQISGRVDTVVAVDPKIPDAAKEALEKAKSTAIEATVANGAVRSTIEASTVQYYSIMLKYNYKYVQ